MKTEVAILGIDVPSRDEFKRAHNEAAAAAARLARVATEPVQQKERTFVDRRLEGIPHHPGDAEWIVTVADLFPVDRQESLLLKYGQQYLAVRESCDNESEAQRSANLWLLGEAEAFDRERLANSEERRRVAAGFRPSPTAAHH